MAVEDVNQAGGIKALGGAHLKLLPFDAGDSTDRAKDAAQRMIAQQPDLVGGFGCWLSSSPWPLPRSRSALNCHG
jgi:branched-chain amino acid transport system substrate-binding protein